ncbi:MAG: hypothetical protein K2W95_22070 [Candidatus Obscuribacterales bacterium]|nr:hypothetical protein [Candidatus Obscuribacterales bacterium]
MSRWNDSTRELPPAQFKQIVQNVAWRLEIDFLGEGSSYNREGRDLPLSGFGSMLFCDYLELATKRGLEYIVANGLRLDRNCSTVTGVDMIVFRPFHLNEQSKHHARDLSDEARHCPRGYGPRRCFYCGEEATEKRWRDGGNSGTDHTFGDEKCSAFMDVMVGPDPVPGLVKRVAAAVGTVNGLIRRSKPDGNAVHAAYSHSVALGCMFMRMADFVRPELFVEAETAAARKAQFNEAAAMALTMAAKTVQIPGVHVPGAHHADDLLEAARQRRAS